MLIQLPAPPAPPAPPAMIFQTGGPEMNSASIAMIVIVALIAATLILWPLVRAFARRLEGKSAADPALIGEIEELRSRVNELEAGQGRMAELEERLDFTERMLVQGRADPSRAGGGS